MSGRSCGKNLRANRRVQAIGMNGRVAAEQLNVTVTLELFQPAAFGAGLVAAVMVGLVLSSLIVAEALAGEPKPPRVAHCAVKGLPGSGKPEELMNAAGIGPRQIAAAARRLLQR